LSQLPPPLEWEHLGPFTFQFVSHRLIRLIYNPLYGPLHPLQMPELLRERDADMATA